MNTVKNQRTFENTSNTDVATAQEKYYKQSENEKNSVRVARRVQANGGLDHDPPAVAKYAKPEAAASLAQGEEKSDVVPFTPS